MGVGFKAIEASRVNGFPEYPNLVDQMVSERFIQSRTYSLYLDDIDTQTGSILFGGIDTEKFIGNLSTLPINLDGNGTASRFVITLTGMSLTPPNGKSVGLGPSASYPINVVLDSGTTSTYLPQDIVSAIADATGAIYVSNIQKYVFENCSQEFVKGTLNFFFSGVEISVPYDQFIVHPVNKNDVFITDDSGNLICELGIASSGSDIAVLGDTFLRSAYVVYDLVLPQSFSSFSPLSLKSGVLI